MDRSGWIWWRWSAIENNCRNNGKIITADNKLYYQEIEGGLIINILFSNFKQINKKGLWSLIVEDGIIQTVGNKDKLDISNQSFSDVYDLEENYLLPSFTDAHMHLSLYTLL